MMKMIVKTSGGIREVEVEENADEQKAYEEAERNRPPTTAERLAALEGALLEMMGVTG